MKTSFKHAKIFSEKEAIITELTINNLTNLVKVVKDSDSAQLIEKIITFADVRTNRKKAYVSKDKNKKEAFSDENILARANANTGFYTDIDDIVAFEKKHKKDKVFFNQTKQNSIYVPSQFYSFLGISDATKHQSDSSFKQYLINDFGIETFLCNSSMSDYFGKDYTQKTYDSLHKSETSVEVNLSKTNFTKTKLHITPHGLGTTEDGPFEQVRENVFAKDKLIILSIISGKTKKVYFAFFRNPKFFLLNKLFNRDYFIARYSEEINNTTKDEGRVGQAKWRDELAELSIGINDEDTSFVTCPFTGTKVQYPQESAFLRASHIKAYSKCKTPDGKTIVEEAYDIDNGFLVLADVDALFDKYLLSVNPDNGEIVKSPTLTSDVVKHLDLKSKILEPLTEQKKKYLQVHYNEFISRNSL